jgi:hypothetical protein
LDYSGPAPEVTPYFLKEFDGLIPFDTNPLYAILHESCYTQGPATCWAAQRVREQTFAEVFDAEACSRTIHLEIEDFPLQPAWFSTINDPSRPAAVSSEG